MSVNFATSTWPGLRPFRHKSCATASLRPFWLFSSLYPGTNRLPRSGHNSSNSNRR
nr:unnamed protein product [Callosobruchus analis]